MKQRHDRARDSDEEHSEDDLDVSEDHALLAGAEIWTIHIRCSSGPLREFELRISPDATIKQMSDILSKKLQINERQQSIRMIYQGKLLPEFSGHVISSELKNNSFLHLAISPKPRSPIQRASSSTTELPRASTGPAPAAIPRGLDVLTRPSLFAGSPLSPDEVAALRACFSEAIEEFGREQRLARGPSESEEDFRLRRESDWLTAQGPGSEFRLNLSARPALSSAAPAAPVPGEASGADRLFLASGIAAFSAAPDTDSAELGSLADFLYGLALGYLVGFIIVFCLWDRNVSHRQKLGLLVGVMLQLATDALWAQRPAAATPAASSSGAETLRPVTASLRGSLHGQAASPLLRARLSVVAGGGAI